MEHGARCRRPLLVDDEKDASAVADDCNAKERKDGGIGLPLAICCPFREVTLIQLNRMG
jgi:hypothetical protein